MRVPVLYLVLVAIISRCSGDFEPNWDSLDSRVSPTWYDKAKIGIFIHWGVFSVPSIVSEWFWQQWNGSDEIKAFMKANYPEGFTYQEFAKDFTAEFFDPSKWADLFAKSGAKYVVLTSKHHEGFTLWPSKYSFSWNAKDIGPHRDVIDELGTAVRNANLKFGLYHSLFEWFNPIYLSDKNNGYKTQEFVDNKIIPEMKELINIYKPSILWSDGEWEAPDTYWKATEFLAWVYNESPVKDEIVVNDRWGTGTLCLHSDFYTCVDRYDPGVLQAHKWENAMTLDKYSWGYRRNAVLSDFLTPVELLTTLARTISCGGNILINVGPTKEGTISPILQERLLQLGDWLSINGEAVYESVPWTTQNDTLNGNVWYTSKDSAIYAFVLEWPTDNTLSLGSPVNLFSNSGVKATILGNDDELKWELKSDQVDIKFSDKATVKSAYAWVVKIAKS